MITLGLDPGPLESAYVLLAEDGKTILAHEDLVNDGMIEYISNSFPLFQEMGGMEIACEMVQHYGSGMPVGAEIFQTVLWVGRFQQKAAEIGAPFFLIFRPHVKQHLCHTVAATDANIRQALIDLIGPVRQMELVKKYNRKGQWQMVKKLTKGPLDGIHDHQWAALAVAVTRRAQASTATTSAIPMAS